MKKLIAYGIVMTLGSATLVQSEPIVVRSGEHDSFTRLVLPLPEGQEWQIESEPGVSRLAFPSFDDGFDLSLAFEIIPRTRLSALVAQDSVLELQLSCDCPVNAFTEQGNFLVIDIEDGPTLPAQEEPIVVPTSQLPDSGFDYGELLWRDDEIAAPLKTQNTEPIEGEGRSSVVVEPPQPPAGIVLQTQERLLEAFSSAASRGLLDPKWDSIPQEESQEAESLNAPRIFDSSRTEPEPPAPGNGNIRITDSKDVPDGSFNENLGISGASCLDPKRVALAKWGTDESFGVQLGKSNEALYDEVGRLNQNEVLGRAKLYLFFGFGAEARQALRLIPGLGTKYPELIDLANILEYGFVSNPRSLHRFAECPSDVALWGILAAKELPMSQSIDAKAALRALESLPSHLKYFLAQELSKRLIERGDFENASIALRSFARLEESAGSKPKITESDISRHRGKDAEAKEVLKEIIAEDTVEAPDAIIALIDEHVASGTTVPADVALLAEAYAFELRNSENGASMFRAFVLGAAKSAQFGKALDALSDDGQRLKSEELLEATSFVFSELANTSPDPEFLQGYFTKLSEMSANVSAEAMLLIAERLYEIGFLDETEERISQLPGGFQTEALNVLKAKVLLASGNYEDTLTELEGIFTDEASALRGEALEAMGENEEAARLFAEANLPDRAVSTLWLAEEWSQLLDETTPVFGDFSRLYAQEPSTIEPDPEMLSNTQAAVAASAAARSTLQSALDALAVAE